MAGQISLDVARKQGACVPCRGHQDPPAVRPTVTRESAFQQRVIRVPASKLGVYQLAFIDTELFPGSKGSDDVFPVCDGLQVTETYAMPNTAEMIKFFRQRLSTGFPNKTMSQTMFTTVSGAPIIADGINVSSPKETWAEFRRIFRNIANSSMVPDVLQQRAASTDRVNSTTIPLLVMTVAESSSRVLDLAFAMGLFADSPRKSTRDTFWLQGSSSRISVKSETTIVTVTKFLSQNREFAVLYRADGSPDFATATLCVTGDTPAFVMCTTPPSGLSFLTTGGYTTDHQFAPLTTHDGPGWITNPRATRRIRAYWKRGKGAAKIRWFTRGAMRRCIRHLQKYFPENAGGLCANMHKEVTGEWPRGGVIPS